MTYRVIQWATGAMGKSCLRAIIDHPALDLAGLYVYSSAKEGRDAGEIAHRPPTGVTATRSVEKILSLDADVVIHTPRLQSPYTHHNKDIVRLLASGKNVISINGHSYPQYWGRGYARIFEDACQKGGSTFSGTGLNPGFIAEKIALTAAGLCQRIDHIDIREVVDTRQIQNPEYVFDILGFGSDPGAIDPNDPSWPPAEMLNGLYSEVVALVADHLGLPLERVETDHRMQPATRDIETAAGRIRKGTTGHTRWCWHAIVANRRRITLSILWTMENGYRHHDNGHLWKVRIQGLPGVTIAVDLSNPADYPYRTGPEPLALAAAVIHSVPAVCEAPPGILVVPPFAPRAIARRAFRQREVR
jgi:2,4-diaminopentanoate dehydrogenase